MEAFRERAVKSDETRKLIIRHYNSIITDEKDLYRKTNRTMALKLHMANSQMYDNDDLSVEEQKVTKGGKKQSSKKKKSSK